MRKVRSWLFKGRLLFFSAMIVVSPSADQKSISRFLFGNNMEHVYGNEFNRIKSAVVRDCNGLITVLRFPGGLLSDKYFWSDEIGLQSSQLGTREIVNFCRDINAEPLFTVNLKTGSPQLAQRWVAFCNLPSVPDLVQNTDFVVLFNRIRNRKLINEVAIKDFSSLRAFCGDEKPYNVKFWEIGNEIYLDPAYKSQDYALKVKEFSKAMEQGDPIS